MSLNPFHCKSHIHCPTCRTDEVWRKSTGFPEICPDGFTKDKLPMRGLGDVIAAVTSAVGIKPCGGCKQRQETLNKIVPFK